MKKIPRRDVRTAKRAIAAHRRYWPQIWRQPQFPLYRRDKLKGRQGGRK